MSRLLNLLFAMFLLAAGCICVNAQTTCGNCVAEPHTELSSPSGAAVDISTGLSVSRFTAGIAVVQNGINSAAIIDGNKTIEGQGAGANTDSCYWGTSIIQNPPQLGGGVWTIGEYITYSGTVLETGQSNSYGYDNVGFLSNTVDYIRANGPSNGITLPCSAVLQQQMYYICPGTSTEIPYQVNVLEWTVYPTEVENMRGGVSSVLPYD